MKLVELFELPSPWIKELDERALYNAPIEVSGRYYYIYCWVNLDTQWCYVGAHRSDTPYNEECYMGSCGNPHYWRSMKIHEYKCIILSYSRSESELWELEADLVNDRLIDTYSNRGIFNMKVGGIGSFSRDAQRKGCEIRRSKYPKYNGLPDQCMESGRSALKDKYSDTNGLPPQILTAAKLHADEVGGYFKEAHERLKELYPNTNGAPPQFTTAGKRRLLELYPDTNGTPIEWIGSGLSFANKRLKELYPDTNGTPPQFWLSAERMHAEKAYHAMVLTIERFKSDGGLVFDRRTYDKYRIPPAPGNKPHLIKRFFLKCIKFEFDITDILKVFTPKYYPPEIIKDLYDL